MLNNLEEKERKRAKRAVGILTLRHNYRMWRGSGNGDREETAGGAPRRWKRRD